MFNGDWGTSPEFLEEYLIGEGYKIKTIRGKDAENDKKVEELQEEYETFIVTVYNDQYDIMSAVHTMSITCEVEEDGNKVYYIHNTFESNLTGNKYSSIKSAVAAYDNSSIINIIGIKKEEKR